MLRHAWCVCFHIFIIIQVLNLKATGAVLDKDTLYLEEEHLFGILNITIFKLQGLKQSLS